MSGIGDKAGRNRVDELVDRLARAGNLAALEDELAKLDPHTLRAQERESWWHLRGIAAFRRGDRATAYARFLQAREALPDSGQIAFSLAQEHEYRGEAPAMFALFDRFPFPRVPASYALVQVRYAYLWGDFQRGLRYLQPLLHAHFELKIADDTFLYLRGMPFFGQTWACAAALYELRHDLAGLDALTAEAGRSLADFDVAPLERLARAVASADYSAYAPEPRRGNAYLRTLAAVLQAQRATRFADAVAYLDDVHVGEEDLPWLADVLLLARAEAAHRFGMPDEAALVDAFLARQPLLFEPDHAFNFRLLAYQETLRPRYQAGRIRAPG